MDYLRKSEPLIIDISGGDPKMINEFKIFVKDDPSSSPETIDKTLAAFLWGEKEWSEYAPEWLKEG